MPTCRVCKDEKPDSLFTRGQTRPKGGRYKSTICRACDKARQRKAYTPERERRYRANRYAADPSYKVRQHLSHNYGIALEQYEVLLDRQGGACAICCATDPGNRASAIRFHVDHCHETGEIRGLLCSNCNAGVGRFKDNSVFLRRAAFYLDHVRSGLKAKRTYGYGRTKVLKEHR